MVKNESQPKRKRGAQPGNKNAMKHGFYTEDGCRDLRDADAFLKDCRSLLATIAEKDFSGK